VVDAAPNSAQLFTKFFKIGMDGLCLSKAIYYGIANGNGLGVSGTNPIIGPIVTGVTFSGAAANCGSYGPSPIPQPNSIAGTVTNCWEGAPSSLYTALDMLCNANNASFNQVRHARGLRTKLFLLRVYPRSPP
jgi:hypothetical protein